MTGDDWQRLSAWHAAWRDADAEGRASLRAGLAGEPPELVAEFDALAGADADADLTGFLETPAFVLTATHLAREATLVAGTNVGPYRIEGLVGHGGMGIVYRATDVRLDRTVAVKMLSPVGVPDAVHVSRFVQEARLTASVDHPNIVRVFDVGVFDGQPYMVIELLDGETLRARLDRGPLPVADARRVAGEIARGLAAAHASGLVHRDLKPENIVLTRRGVSKILDFGIAKLAPDDVDQRRNASTLTGILLGTVGYLAPEQIRGAATVDARADLFALGSIVYEMLTGERAFACENTVDTLHAILHEPAPDPRDQRPEIPRSLAAITHRLLAKTPDDRFQSAADLVWALDQDMGLTAADAARVTASADDEARATRRLAWPAAALLAIALLAIGWWGGRGARVEPATGGPTRFAWNLPETTGLISTPAVSPDGRRIAWAALDAPNDSALYVRDLSAPAARRLAGTEGARFPFWSPDGQALGFFARGQLKKIVVDSGAAVALARAPDPRGGAWSASGVIVFSPVYRDAPLMQVPADGGPATPVTVLEDGLDAAHRWPVVLPDGKHVLFMVLSADETRHGLYAASLDAPPAVPGNRLLATRTSATFVAGDDARPSVLLSAENGRITARRFDPDRLVVTGDPWMFDLAAASDSPHLGALVSASPTVLAFSGQEVPWGFHHASVSRDGSDLRVATEPELGGFPRISPDGRYVARTIVDIVKTDPDIWSEDTVRGGLLRLTTAQTFDVMPVWSPDGTEIAYRSGRLDEPHIGFSASDGSGPTRTPLPCPRNLCEPTDWSPDGTYLVVNAGSDTVWRVPLDDGPATPMFEEPFAVRDARLSPDGQWIAYVSAESGRAEVSLRSLSGPPRRYVASTDGGDQPVWRRDGRELFFVDPVGRLQAVPVRFEPEGLVLGRPEPLGVPILGARHWGTTYDVTTDGTRIYFPHAGDARPPGSFDVLTGWTALLRR